ncbi:Kap95p [Sugiyamaella lignohabitans]|uniref:Importin-95 n=1 Tax=Sugiyamaella lignohabitans TaxID=796027 RepID=A0A167D6U7_9ASCO|nr:Kap95p [Sugiyamaella lignohabitans]ANB12552.1 Kap95p [Sugiyamaella lignohabitans]
MDIGQVLENAILGRDQQVRAQAEAQLKEAAREHFVPYLGMLTQALESDQQRTEVRILAGIALKNEISSKDIRIQLSQTERWVSLDGAVKEQIKATSLAALISPDERVGNAAAQLIAAIADIELPRDEWPTLTAVLVQNTTAEQPTHVKRASLLAIGYICETADPSNSGVVSQADGILTAIVQGARKEEPNLVVRLTALNALVNSLEFIRLNFDQESERNYIMQVVCEATQAESTELQAAAFGALGRIMSLYYVYMKPYMEKALFGLTVSGMQSSDDMVACMAVEFWSTVCEEEINLALAAQEDIYAGVDPSVANSRNFHFAENAIGHVLPTLLTLLTRQDEDTSDDDWSVSMAAGASLQLFAQNTQNHVVDITVDFVSKNLSSESWVNREAAVMAFGSILEGPDPDRLRQLIGQALMPLLALMKDQSLQVKDTVAWCLGRVADLMIEGIDIELHLEPMIEALLTGLQDHPKVSTNCCWTIMNLTEQLSQNGPQDATSPISQYYPALVPALLSAASRSDNENSSRTSAYEALSTLVIFSPADVLPIVLSLSGEVLNRLNETVALQQQIVGTDDRSNLEELQINLLGLLTNIIRRADDQVLPAAEQLMTLFIHLLETKLPNSLIEEDVFIAIGAVAGATNEHFAQYLDVFMPYLVAALQNSGEYQTCNTAVGLVADISHSVGKQIEKYSDTFMNTFVENLRKDDIRREIKPVILSCIGDVASSIGGGFIPYLQVVMQVLNDAAQLRADEDSSLEFLDYVFSLREAIIDAYVGIVAGMHDSPQALLPYIEGMFAFLSTLLSDHELIKSESVLRSLAGLLGDVASIYPDGQVAPLYRHDWVTEIIRKARDRNFSSATKETAKWAREQQKRQIVKVTGGN